MKGRTMPDPIQSALDLVKRAVNDLEKAGQALSRAAGEVGAEGTGLAAGAARVGIETVELAKTKAVEAKNALVGLAGKK